jgi:hypothetical protein
MERRVDRAVGFNGRCPEPARSKEDPVRRIFRPASAIAVTVALVPVSEYDTVKRLTGFCYPDRYDCQGRFT